ncbi:MAG: DUF1080 domain-containing protein [Planctomycetaceae bacterium]|nr:MAG: DUF1080 domain-containing protein [Planctomycetaceae bacterium]
MQEKGHNAHMPLTNNWMLSVLLSGFFVIFPHFDGLAADVKQDAWTVLFDGQSTEHWRGFRRDGFPRDAWTVEDGMLKPLVEGNVLDLITRQTYENFELELQWRIAPGGNAGIFFMVTEQHPEVWHTGPEVQILDDAGHPDAQDPKTSAGSIYALVAPADAKKLNPPGQWNHARFRLDGGRLRHWLNDVEILDVDFFGDEFRAAVSESNFAKMPDFAKARRGHIALQHASVSPLKARVWYRHIRLRELP